MWAEAGLYIVDGGVVCVEEQTSFILYLYEQFKIFIRGSFSLFFSVYRLYILCSPCSAISSREAGTVTVVWTNVYLRAQDSVWYIIGTQWIYVERMNK